MCPEVIGVTGNFGLGFLLPYIITVLLTTFPTQYSRLL